MRNPLAWSLLVIVLMAATSHVVADTRSWTGAADNDWFNILNWDPSGAPASTDRLLVPSGSPSTAATVAASGGGTIRVDGPAASASFGTLYAGDTGNGWLDVLQGAAVSSSQASVGVSVGSSGKATVDGSDSLWTNDQDLTVGDGGVGVLDITSGGQTIVHQQMVVGDANGSRGTVTVTGSGSDLSIDGDLIVGLSGRGTLTVGDGATLSSAHTYFGRNTGSTGEVTLDGSDTFWTNADELRIGDKGAGVLIVRNGAGVANAAGHIGSSDSGSVAEGSVIVEGSGSSWSSDGDLWVGKVGPGTLQVLAGALVSSDNGEINGSAATASSAAVSGPDSMWACSSSLKVAAQHQGRLDVLDGAMVSSDSGSIGEGSSSQGTARIQGVGSMWIVDNSLYVGGGESGPVGAGLLQVNEDGQAIVGGVLTVWSTGELRGDGTVVGAVEADGLVNPGQSVGLLTIDGTYEQLSGGTLHIELAGTAAGEFDALSITDEVSLDGTLAADLAGGFHPSLGDTFDIITAAAIDGTFATFEGSDLGGGLWLDVVYSDVMVQLVVIPEPATLSLLALGGLAVLGRRK